MRLVQQRGVHYDELAVVDVMTKLPDLDAIDLEVMKHSSVSNVVATLRRHGRNHLLVVERARADYPSRVRGVISRTQVERQLGAPVPVTEVANSFAEVVRMLS
jgi:CBS domain-containing protein